MKSRSSRMLRQLLILFTFSGVAGCLYATYISGSYLQDLPRLPSPADGRMVPRDISGVCIYQTAEEDRRLTIVQTGSAAMLSLGLALWVIRMRRWGIAEAIGAELDEEDPEHQIER
jgi:hypothetical protein